MKLTSLFIAILIVSAAFCGSQDFSPIHPRPLTGPSVESHCRSAHNYKRLNFGATNHSIAKGNRFSGHQISGVESQMTQDSPQIIVARAVFQLFARHFRPGMTVREIGA